MGLRPAIFMIALICGIWITSEPVSARDIDLEPICEAYEDHKEPISPQHRYVKRLGVLSCRMHYRVHEMPWMHFSEEGNLALELVDHYREAVKRLLECTGFNYENTREDRVYACSNQMDLAYKYMFALSDHLEYIRKIITGDCHDVLVHNRRGLDIIIGQTKYKRPTRSWYDFGEEI